MAKVQFRLTVIWNVPDIYLSINRFAVDDIHEVRSSSIICETNGQVKYGRYWKKNRRKKKNETNAEKLIQKVPKNVKIPG